MNALRIVNPRRSRFPLVPNGSAHPLLASVALVLFALRALVPVGFEPANDGSLALVLCRQGLPPPLQRPASPNRGGATGHGDHCLFCSSPSTAPAPQPASPVSVPLLVLGAVTFRAPATQAFRLVHIPQARAPPAAA